MHMASNRQAAAGSVTARETPVVEACHVLTSLVTESSDRKPVFLAEGGVIALMELLEERSTKARAPMQHHSVRIKCRVVVYFPSWPLPHQHVWCSKGLCTLYRSWNS